MVREAFYAMEAQAVENSERGNMGFMKVMVSRSKVRWGIIYTL